MKTGALAAMAAVLLIGGCASKGHTLAREGDRVRLELAMPKAAIVQLVLSSSGYMPVSAEKSSGGVWLVEVNGSAPFEYFYLVDGVSYSPQCELSRPDGFGGKTCIYEPGL